MIGDEVSHFYLRLLHVVKPPWRLRLRFVSSVCEKKILGISNTLKTMPDPESFSNTAGGAPKKRKSTKSKSTKSTKSKSTKSKSKSKKSKSSKK
jgi:hypothetical protein